METQTEAQATGRPRSFIQRMIGAAMLDVDTYEEVEHDLDATLQAAGVVALVAVCAAVGGASHGEGGIIARPIGSLLGWIVWAGMTFFIGTRLFDGVATWGEMLRTIGFAHAPGVLFVVSGFPLLGGLIAAAASIWMLIAGIVAIRQGLDISTGKALITVFLGWLAMVVVAVAVGLLFGVPAAIFGSVAG
ncbi:MAG: Yip1 family protein [Gemmatimonadota bacterium]|nr:Yip1 family protein [Gemmatimonadota bacterium]